MKILNKVLILLFFVLNLSNDYAQTTYQDINIMMNQIYPDNLPGAALMVLQNGRLVISKGYGVSDLKTRENISPDTHFRMASVSKQFTAMCILLLQKQDKLSITDAASKYLPTLPGCARDVTIRQLMTHTSGIMDYESLIAESQKTQVSDADVLSLISKTDSLYFTPGTQFKYSNTGFCLLTQIIEKVSGIPYPEFIEKNIFLPLRMKNTAIYQKDKDIFERAYGTHRRNGEWIPADQSVTSATMGDGSVYTSLNDYQRWIQWLWKQQFVDQANPLMPHIKIRAGLDYGYGWFIAREADGSTGYFHSGQSIGFHNIVYHNPSKKLAVMLFSNSDDERISRAFEEVIHTLHIELKDVPAGVSLFDFLSGIYGD